MVEKCNAAATTVDEKAHRLYNSCHVLVQCFENPILGPNLISQHLADVLVALLQICYAPREGPFEKIDSSSDTQVQQRSRPASVTVQEGSEEDKAPYLSVTEKKWCVSTLHKLLNKTYQPLVVRELLAIQRMAAIGSVPATRGKFINFTELIIAVLPVEQHPRKIMI